MADADMSKVESIKAESHHLRGSIAAELDLDTPVFTEASGQLLKFHGVYQQDDRDLRKEARKLGMDKHHQMMIRTRIPGGEVGVRGYLAHDDIAEKWGNRTMRVTTRQDFQLHGILKGDMRAAIRAINETVLTTFGGCGDQERNIMCCPAPIRGGIREQVSSILAELVPALTPSTRAYHEIWIDGDLAVSSEPESEPLYGDTYLPRKFKTAIALENDNCIDAYANDLALVAMADATTGDLAGFNVLVGGGMGRHRNKPETFAAVAQPMAFVGVDQVVATSRAILAVQRDHGDRTNRRHARLKYLLADRGVDWFRQQVQERIAFTLLPARPMTWPLMEDHLGWHEQGDGLLYLGVFIENGRIADTASCRLRTGLRTIIEAVTPRVLLTAQQNVILGDIAPADRERIDSLMHDHGIAQAEELPNAVRFSMACPAWPTCGLATAEAERVLPQVIREIAALTVELGLEKEPTTYRMTGCPNGCARPYQGDVGLVGTTLGKYDVFLGGDQQGTRLNELYATAVPIGDLVALLRGPLRAFGEERHPGEGFGDWCRRQGLAALRSRFDIPVPAAALASAPPVITPLPVLTAPR